MSFGLVQTVAPNSEPATVADAKAHCRVQNGLDDTYLADLIVAARERVEQETGRQLVTASWRLTLDRFPPGSLREGRGRRDSRAPLDWLAIDLPRPPLHDVTAITYVDTAGNIQTLDPALYQVDPDTHPGRVMPAYGQIWPVARYQAGAVRVDYRAGYGAASAVPGSLKRAVLMLVAHWHATREAAAAGATLPVPLNFGWIVDSYWCGEVR